MHERRDDMTTRYENGHPDPHRDRDGTYEHPALEPEPGYWAGRWGEFKRLFALFWNDGYTKEAVILSILMITVGIVGGWLFGWG